MKAIVNTNHKFEYSEVEEPKLDERFNILIEVKASGLCGSDMHRINSIDDSKNKPNYPIMGHEVSGVVKSIHKSRLNSKFKVGDRVAVQPIVYCQECDQCKSGDFQFCQNIIGIGKNKNGGFAERLVVPEENLYHLKDSIDFATGSLLDIVSVCVHIQNLAEGFNKKRIAVIGDGAIGLATAILVKISGGHPTVVGKHRNLGFDFIDYQDEPTIDKLESQFDLVIETVGRDSELSLNTAIKLTKIKGTIIVAGVYPPGYKLPINARSLFYKEIKLIGSNSFSMTPGSNQPEPNLAIKLIEQHGDEFKKIITDQLPLSEFADGVNRFNTKSTSKSIKIIFNPN